MPMINADDLRHLTDFIDKLTELSNDLSVRVGPYGSFHVELPTGEAVPVTSSEGDDVITYSVGMADS
jgi:hypothetical protein